MTAGRTKYMRIFIFSFTKRHKLGKFRLTIFTPISIKRHVYLRLGLVNIIAQTMLAPTTIPIQNSSIANSLEKFGGEGGIRTHGAREDTPVFKTGTFGRSVTSPKR